ncbi:MAG: hypothetical protein ACC700_16955 [Anaerolineales bacterium]
MATGLTSVEVFHLVAFSSVVATAVGIYLLCWIVLKSKVVGLISAILYLLAPITWFYVYEHGLVTTVIAASVIPYAVVALDRFLKSRINDAKGTQSRVWLFILVLLMAFSLLSHTAIGAGMALIATIYSIVGLILFSKNKRVRVLGITFRSGLLLVTTLTLLITFWLIPVYRYSSATGDAQTLSPDQIRDHRQYLEELTSLTELDNQLYATNLSFPTFIVGFAALGLALAWIHSKKGEAFAVIGLFGLLAAGSSPMKVTAAELGSFIPYIFGERTLLLAATIFIPIGAALGIFMVAKGLANPISRFLQIAASRFDTESDARSSINKVVVSLFSILLAATSIWYFRSASSRGAQYLNYGVERGAGIDLLDIWGTGQKNEALLSQLRPGNWPRFELAANDQALEDATKTLGYLPNQQASRIGISPYIGRLAQNMVLLVETNQAAIYTATADLIKPFQGYKGNVMYSEEPQDVEFGSPGALNEIAKWFGIQYAFTQPSFDPTSHYVEAGWQMVGEYRYGSLPIELWEFPGRTELASYSSKPLALVIGSASVNSYESVFKLATRGAMPYEQFTIVDGTKAVDEYEYDEISQFDILVLHGYTYEDSDKAWSLLDQYVAEGGALFIDTGWQWSVPEWEFEFAPSVLPISRTAWGDYGITDQFLIESAQFTIDENSPAFEPLAWESQPWSLNTLGREDVRIWADILLSVDGNPVIVYGEYGQGKVVWSGMNFISHALDSDNPSEIALMQNIMAWLAGEEQPQDRSITFNRDHPDAVEFALDSSIAEDAAIYWREAYYPAWHAYYLGADNEKQELDVYSAGPGFMLIPVSVEFQNGIIELVWETSITERLAGAVSFAAALTLLAYVIDGLVFEGRAFDRIKNLLRSRRRKPQPQGRVEWLDDIERSGDDYGSENDVAFGGKITAASLVSNEQDLISRGEAGHSPAMFDD